MWVWVCLHICLCTCVDFYVFMWYLTPEGMLCFRGSGGGVVSPCVWVCVCVRVRMHQTVPATTELADTQPLSLQPPPLLRPPSYGSHSWERQEKWNNRDERHSSGVFRSPMPWVFSLPPAPSSQLHDFLHPPMTAPICVCVSPAASLCLFHSLNSAPRAETVCSLIMSTELACLRPPLSLWQAPIVFAKYANDSVCVHLSWPGSRFPPPSVSPI